MFSVEDVHWWYVALHELVLDTVSKEHSAKGRLSILDAGCGTGRLCMLMLPFGDVHGLDAYGPAVDLCRARGLNSVVQADLNIEPLGDCRYDVVTSIDVLYHLWVENDIAVIRKMFSALKPGGILILHLPAFNFIRSLHDIAVFTRHRYTARAVRRKLSGSGFVTEKVSYRIFFLFPLIAIFRLAGKIFARRENKGGNHSDVTLPPKGINNMLAETLRFENRLMAAFNLPFGSSVFAVARKPHSRQLQDP